MLTLYQIREEIDSLDITNFRLLEISEKRQNIERNLNKSLNSEYTYVKEILSYYLYLKNYTILC